MLKLARLVSTNLADTPSTSYISLLIVVDIVLAAATI